MPTPSPADVFGGGSDAAAEDMDMDMDMEMAPEDDVPPDFQSAYDEYEAAPSAGSMYRMIEACKAGSGGGLALLLEGKGKKK